MATTSPFDPDKVDPEFYSKDPNQHGDSDFGRESEGVGNNAFAGGTAGMDMEAENRNITQHTREANLTQGRVGEPQGESLGTTQEWDVDPNLVSKQSEGRMMSDEAAQKLSDVAENPSDDALLHRADATYLEEGDDPNAGYDPHDKGYTGANKTDVQKNDRE